MKVKFTYNWDVDTNCIFNRVDLIKTKTEVLKRIKEIVKDSLNDVLDSYTDTDELPTEGFIIRQLREEGFIK